eukprot:scaffold22650_cov55-Phaeocystis_antarctica.AAC.2
MMTARRVLSPSPQPLDAFPHPATFVFQFWCPLAAVATSLVSSAFTNEDLAYDPEGQDATMASRTSMAAARLRHRSAQRARSAFFVGA